VSFALIGAFGAALLYGVGTVLQAAGLRRSARSAATTAWARALAAWPYLLGLALDGLGFLASVAALRSLPLFVVESAVASSVAVTAVLARFFLGGRLERSALIALVMVGVGLLALAASAVEGPGVPLGGAGGRLVLLATIPVAVLGLFASRLRTGIAVPLLAVVAGLGFGGTGVAARVLRLTRPWERELADPVLWALLVYALIALVAYGLALQRGSVTVVAAVTFTVETVVPAAIGLLWLGDKVRPGTEWLTVVAFVLTLGGSVRLARFATGEPAATRR
jgi:drug/metabolite transporter (DMT)-like permease